MTSSPPLAPATAESSWGWLRPALPLAASVLLVSMVAQFRAPLLPAMGLDLAMSASQIGLVTTVFSIGRLALDMPAGQLADRVDPLKLLAFAAATMGLGTLGFTLAPSAGWVLVASLFVGAASATGNTTGMTALSGAAPASRRGSAMALYSGALLGGQSLGPALAGGVAGLGTWRTGMYAGAVLGVTAAAGAFAWRRRKGHAPLQRAVRKGAGEGEATLTKVQRAALYGVCFSVFFTVASMPQTLIPLIGALDHDLRTATIGLALGLGGIARIVGSAVTGLVSDRVSRRAALIPALVLQSAGVGLLMIGGGAGVWLAAIVLMSLGTTGNAVAATMLGDRTPGTQLGKTLGRYRFWGDIGALIGPALVAFTYDQVGTAPAAAIVSGVLAVCAVAATLLVPETHGRSSREALVAD